MANIPENTTNPILRPVTQLEITNKVFGGTYIPDDSQQRGISNLQAIELAERDQYIISRVGQAAVPESGDIPAEVGIAPLDTGGKLPKSNNTANVTYTGDTQTLTNKTMACADNHITTTASKVIVSDANGYIGAGSIDAAKLVATDESQTLTNKTITYDDNTLTGVQPTLTAGTGINISSNTISTKQTYSTSEKDTGNVWIDGKKIYRKVVTADNVTPSSYLDRRSVAVATTISNLGTLINSYGQVKLTGGSYSGRIYPLNGCTVGGNMETILAGTIRVTDGTTVTGLLFTTVSGAPTSADLIMVLEYTKTS